MGKWKEMLRLRWLEMSWIKRKHVVLYPNWYISFLLTSPGYWDEQPVRTNSSACGGSQVNSRQTKIPAQGNVLNRGWKIALYKPYLPCRYCVCAIQCLKGKKNKTPLLKYFKRRRFLIKTWVLYSLEKYDPETLGSYTYGTNMWTAEKAAPWGGHPFFSFPVST